MTYIHSSLSIPQKLEVLSRGSQYDLACSCATASDEHRCRSSHDTWIYPVTFASGRRTFLFKTLLSNACRNDCGYCPLRITKDTRRVSLLPYELAKTFLEHIRRKKVSGLFLTSGTSHAPDEVMNRINGTARIVRRSGFGGYIHLKIIPGASQAAVRESLALASAVSLNVEFPRQEQFRELAPQKDYQRDILKTVSYISRMRMEKEPSRRPHQTTQFIVGAARETDGQIVRSTAMLYRRLKLNRVYFSAYQRGQGQDSIPGERSHASNAQLLTREHRLYQTDWLLRKYRFRADEIPLEDDDNLSLVYDPKKAWAMRNPQFFPVNINAAERWELLRVPGLGAVSVNRILAIRRRQKIHSLSVLGSCGKRLTEAEEYVSF